MTQSEIAAAPQGAACILLVDDDAGDRKALARALRRSGVVADCVETESVMDGLAACEERPFDCAIVDYRMPGGDGLAGIALLREHFPHLPIIMSTGQGDEMVATEAMKLGASDYISKSLVTERSIGRSVNAAIEKAHLQRKLAEHREELEKFASVLAHDLSEPLASMQLFVRTIEEELESATIDRAAALKLCKETIDASRRARALIDTLHEYAKAEARLPFAAVDMNAVLSAALKNLARAIERSGAVVTFGELPTVEGNEPQLTQLMQNLVGNALKYCDAAAPAIEIAAAPAGSDRWRIAVKDNGIGVAKSDCRAVFAPFKRLKAGEDRQGLGLGLAICKRLVERHGGDIACESDGEGKGATFAFTLRAPQRRKERAERRAALREAI